MKRSIGPYEGRRVRLRSLEAADLPLTMLWRNKERCRTAFRSTDPITEEDHRLWFEGYEQKEDDFVFVIESKHLPGRLSGVRIGQISLYHVTSQEAELGRMMIGDDSFLRKGCALEAVEILVQEAGPGLGLSEIYLEVRSQNAAAIALYQRAGFIHDGIVICDHGTFVRMAVDIEAQR